MKRYTTTPELSIGFLDVMLMSATNPFNHVGMTQKVPYIPNFVGLGPKLWSVTLKLCQRAYSSVPLFVAKLRNKKARLTVGGPKLALVDHSYNV